MSIVTAYHPAAIHGISKDSFIKTVHRSNVYDPASGFYLICDLFIAKRDIQELTELLMRVFSVVAQIKLFHCNVVLSLIHKGSGYGADNVGWTDFLKFAFWDNICFR